MKCHVTYQYRDGAFIELNGCNTFGRLDLNTGFGPITFAFRAADISEDGEKIIVNFEGAGTQRVGLLIFNGLCPGDFDGDGMVGFSDLTLLLAQWGPFACPDPNFIDLDDDQDIGFGDLLILLSRWGPCSDPGSGAVPPSVLDCLNASSQPARILDCLNALAVTQNP